jgi:hypothetical protein
VMALGELHARLEWRVDPRMNPWTQWPWGFPWNAYYSLWAWWLR